MELGNKDDELVGDAIRRWQLLVRQHEANCIDLTSRGVGQIEMAMRQRLQIELEKLSGFLASEAEKRGIDSSELILFRIQPDTCRRLAGASVVVERLTYKLPPTHSAKDAVQVLRGEKGKETEKRVRAWLMKNFYKNQYGGSAKAITIKRIQRELSKDGFKTSTGSIVQTKAWSLFQNRRMEQMGGKKGRRIGLRHALDEFQAPRGADGAEDVDTTIERLTAEQSKDRKSRILHLNS